MLGILYSGQAGSANPLIWQAVRCRYRFCSLRTTAMPTSRPSVRMKRLTLDLPEALHRVIKKNAAEEGVPMAQKLRAILAKHYRVSGNGLDAGARRPRNERSQFMEPARATPGGRLAMMMQAAGNDGRARRWSIDVMRTVSRCCDARHGRQRSPKGGRRHDICGMR